MENKFLLNTVVENKSNNESDDLILTGIASTANERSLYGELMTEDALNQMCQQAVGLPILEGHDGKSLDNVIGVITNAYIEDNDLHIDFKVTPNHRERIQEFLDTGIPIGLSIGAQGEIDTETQKVVSITLVEVSLTPIPANRVAHNTVKVKDGYYIGNCLSGICHQMIKDNLEVIDMAEETNVTQEVEEVKEEPLTIEKVKNMLDERFAEEKEALVATIVDEVKTQLKKVEESFEVEEIEDAVKEEEEEEEPKEGASEGGDSEEEEKEVKESITIDEDKIVNDITEIILESLGEKRDVSSTKTEEALKESAEPEEEAKPFTSEEAAKFIINDMNRRDPLARAINEARNL